ncbi:hypothetical protein [Hyphomonas sp.]|uniref:hypothetical protein n=1 Tax=Hyphomonas sp. TaxID=87 RepID=UPI001BCC1C72|nr:hypothetical protein [Hyphomonas sp.]
MPTYSRSVFINCPFSDDFAPMFRAMVFAVVDCGYEPRCALETNDGGQIRLQKIEAIIEQSKFGIHDLSNMELDEKNFLPRFNMPLELGLFLGARRFGSGTQKDKRLIILDKEPHRYKIAMSDISGRDISHHSGDPGEAILCIRDWLKTVSRRKNIPGAKYIVERYQRYEIDLPEICKLLKYDADTLIFNDLWETMVEWQKANLES